MYIHLSNIMMLFQLFDSHCPAWSEARASWSMFWLQLVIAVLGGTILNSHYRWVRRVEHYITVLWPSKKIKWHPYFSCKNNKISIGIYNHSGHDAKDTILTRQPQYIIINNYYLKNMSYNFDNFENSHGNNKYFIENPWNKINSSLPFCKKIYNTKFQINRKSTDYITLTIPKAEMDKAFNWGVKNVSYPTDGRLKHQQYDRVILIVFEDLRTKIHKPLIINSRYDNLSKYYYE